MEGKVKTERSLLATDGMVRWSCGPALSHAHSALCVTLGMISKARSMMEPKACPALRYSF